MEQDSTSDQRRGHDAWKGEVGDAGRKQRSKEEQEAGARRCIRGRRDRARVMAQCSRVVSGVRKVLAREGGCFRKGCSQNVKRTRMRGFANSSAQKTTLPTGHKNMREDLRCSTGL